MPSLKANKTPHESINVLFNFIYRDIQIVDEYSELDL